jgi:quinol monooxygenase YgiN
VAARRGQAFAAGRIYGVQAELGPGSKLYREVKMVVEYIRYNIDDGRAEAFEDAYRRASEALETSEHCERYEVSRCSEDPTQHVVRIEWDSEDGHLSGFRRSPEFRGFFEAVGPFVHDIEEMRHYQVTFSSSGSGS